MQTPPPPQTAAEFGARLQDSFAQIGAFVPSLLGALVSAATVLLLTPKSGETVRADIKHEVDAIMEEGRRAADTRRAELEAQLAQMRGETPFSTLGQK